MTDLHDLLDLATDRLDAPGLASGALATARRRRRNRRAGVVALAAVTLVVAGVAAAGLVGDAPSEPEPAPPVETIEPTPFDPRTVEELPRSDVAPQIPAVLPVPGIAPRIEDDPLDRAVLAVDDGADILLLDEDGAWHCVVVAGRTPADPALSDDGTQLAVGVRDGANDEVVVIDLATGNRTSRPGFPSYGIDWTIGETVVRGTARWTVRPLAQLPDGTGLLQVAPGPPHPGGWWLVRWDPATDDWSRVSRLTSDPDQAVSLAVGLLGSSS